MNIGTQSLFSSKKAFSRAKNKAFFESLLAQLRGEPIDLLPFEQVRQKLRLANRAYRGIHDVPLSQIAGSVGRYRDFTRTFLPRSADLENRWATIDQLATDVGFPPVELYKVDETYFVSDGHHRISVARQAKALSIEAHVWEYPVRVALEPGTTVDDLLIKEEYVDFLGNTRLDQSRPEQRIEFTTPGRYRELEYRIALYQSALSEIDGEPFSYEEAATFWYDMIYTAVVQIIQQQEMLKDFPGRTEADLFIWVVRHQQELSETYGYPVPMEETTYIVTDQYGVKWPQRFLIALKERLLGQRSNTSD